MTLLEVTSETEAEEHFVSVHLSQAAKEFLLQTLFRTVPHYRDSGEERGL